jgi:hypothetical protein
MKKPQRRNVTERRKLTKAEKEAKRRRRIALEAAEELRRFTERHARMMDANEDEWALELWE